MTIQKTIMGALPEPGRKALRNLKRKSFRTWRQLIEAMGYKLARTADYYSPLPSEFALQRNQARWNKPSAMAGIPVDVDSYKRRLTGLLEKYGEEFRALPSYADVTALGFGPGFPILDAMVLYMTMRATKPRRYMEVGSGVSTYYCTLAAERNSTDGHPLEITCIEPYPFDKLRSIQGIKIVHSEVQDVPVELFLQLEENDVLFIDSSHALAIDGDIPFLFLEVLPRLRKGVLIHIHDIGFPYNIPYPAEYWVLCEHETSLPWPMYWNEAMALQAFLAFNSAFEIELSTPLIRYYDEPFMAAVPFYKSVIEAPNTFSSIWIRKTA